MRVAVLVKQVPDSWAVKRLRADDVRLDRDACDRVLNDLDEYAIEQALVWQETLGAEVVLISMGPAVAEEALRRGLSMGADSAVLVSDSALAGVDVFGTAQVLAAAVRHVAPDVVLTGVASTDGATGVVPSMVAEMLGWPGLTRALSVELGDGRVIVSRESDYESVTLNAALPAVVSIADHINTPRFPNFKGIMAAKKKVVEVLTLADLGLAIESARAVAVGSDDVPTRVAGPKVVDTGGDSVSALVEFLDGRGLLSEVRS